MPERIKPVRGYNIRVNGDQLVLDETQNATTSEGVVIGNPWGYISDVNDFVLKLYGAKDKADLVGKHILEFLPKEEKNRAIESSLEAIAFAKARTELYKVRLKSGQEVTLKVYVDFLENEDNEKMGFIDIIKTV